MAIITTDVPVLDVRDLTVAYDTAAGVVQAVRGVSFAVSPREIFALVGESGSGKSTTAHAIMGHFGSNGRQSGGEIRYRGRALSSLGHDEIRDLRGSRIAIIHQDPNRALNPIMSVGAQVAEVITTHRGANRASAWRTAVEMLVAVNIPDPEQAARRYPHEMSGGQKQRVLIAIAFACDPDLLILDEPTSGLDTTNEAAVLALLSTIIARQGAAALFITHNLGLVSRFANRVAVMSKGEIVEQGKVGPVFATPQHAYTRQLLAAIPDMTAGRPPRPMIGEPVVMSAQGLRFEYRLRGGLHHLKVRHFVAVHDIGFVLRRNETLALVGESGAGKTTIGRMVVGLAEPSAGEIHLHAQRLGTQIRRRTWAELRSVQMIFQNPDVTLNPAKTVGYALARALHKFRPNMNPDAIQDEVASLLMAVSLPPAFAKRMPNQLSGGQKQRVAIARALAAAPDIIVCDEPLSALDVSVQAAILKLLRALQDDRGVSYLFISHDLAVVRVLADRIIVLYRGVMCETGSTTDIFKPPFHPYTEALLGAMPIADPRVRQRKVEMRDTLPELVGVGCPYAARCHRRVGSVCETDIPPHHDFGDGHHIACHLSRAALCAIAPVLEFPTATNLQRQG